MLVKRSVYIGCNYTRNKTREFEKKIPQISYMQFKLSVLIMLKVKKKTCLLKSIQRPQNQMDLRDTAGPRKNTF